MSSTEKNSRITSVEDYISELLAKAKYKDGTKVFPRVFTGSIPPAIKSEWQSFVWVDITEIYDYDGYAVCSANIYLFAKPVGSLLEKNHDLLDTMEYCVYELIKKYGDNDEKYYLLKEWAAQDYDENRQMHFHVISIGVTIK
ncbi:MAG: hypothetical protein HUK08_06725 [Bacteroidaceae bacterium]|nr:hypothetical protein [Bacteroidaceae bacterium]